MLALLGDAEDQGAMLAFHAPVERGRVAEDGIVLEVGGAEPMALCARTVINSAGPARAGAGARASRASDAELVPPAVLLQGQLFHARPARGRSRT